MIEVRAVQDSDSCAWEEVARASDDAWLSHSWEWNTAVEERVRGGARRSLVVIRDGRLVGIVPQHLHVEQRGPLSRRVLYANYWIGGGVALVNDLTTAARAECVDAAMRATHAQARCDRVDKMLMTLPPISRRNLRKEAEARRAIGAGFVDRSTTALVIQLRGRTADEVWKDLEGRGRTKVRKAERAGVRIVQVSGPDALEQFHALHLATYARTGARAYPRAYFEAVLAAPHCTVFFAELDGRTLGGLIVATYAGRAQYFASASVEEALHLGVNNLLQWHALRCLLELDVEAYELGVLPDPRRPASAKMLGIAQFLRSFGGDTVPAHQGEFVYDRTRHVVFAVARNVIERAGLIWPD